jgi:hypothetical protein
MGDRRGRAGAWCAQGVLACVALAAMIVGPCAAAPAAAVQKRMWLGPSAFHPVTEGDAYFNDLASGVGEGSVVAEPAVPPGATITGARLFAVDDDVADIVAFVGYTKLKAGKASYKLSFGSSGQSPDARIFPGALSLALDPVSVPWVMVNLPAATTKYRLHGIEITYEEP